MKPFFALSAALAAATPGAAWADNLVVNGGFETGDFTGWTQFDNPDNTAVAGQFGLAPHSGDYQGVFGPVDSTGGITQVLNTVAGQNYTISLWLANLGNHAPNYASISFGGQTLQTFSDAGGFAYTNLTYSAVATGAQTALTFTFRNGPSYFIMDDVSVSGLEGTPAVPEPATWGMMIAGFGVVGASLRRRTAAVTALA